MSPARNRRAGSKYGPSMANGHDYSTMICAQAPASPARDRVDMISAPSPNRRLSRTIPHPRFLRRPRSALRNPKTRYPVESPFYGLPNLHLRSLGRFTPPPITTFTRPAFQPAARLLCSGGARESPWKGSFRRGSSLRDARDHGGLSNAALVSVDRATSCQSGAARNGGSGPGQSALSPKAARGEGVASSS